MLHSRLPGRSSTCLAVALVACLLGVATMDAQGRRRTPSLSEPGITLVLGRPTDTSVVLSVLSKRTASSTRRCPILPTRHTPHSTVMPTGRETSCQMRVTCWLPSPPGACASTTSASIYSRTSLLPASMARSPSRTRFLRAERCSKSPGRSRRPAPQLQVPLVARPRNQSLLVLGLASTGR